MDSVGVDCRNANETDWRFLEFKLLSIGLGVQRIAYSRCLAWHCNGKQVFVCKTESSANV